MGDGSSAESCGARGYIGLWGVRLDGDCIRTAPESEGFGMRTVRTADAAMPPLSLVVAREGRDRVLAARQVLPASIDDVFPFFAEAANLERITPPWLRFRIVTEGPVEMRVGALIDYRLRVRGAPLRWRTRISAWDPPHRFEDEQVRGPYVLWKHEHTFTPVPGGTMCVDRVRFRAPLGALVHDALVVPDVRRIFRYRGETLARIFGGDGALTSCTPSRGSA